MKTIIVKDHLEGAQKGYEIIRQELDNGNLNVIGLATGSTPLSLYEIMRNSDIDFTNTISINLDEYVGLEPTHDQSYNYFMNKNLFEAKPFKKNYLPDGSNLDDKAVCAAYEKIMEENPIDLQILGIGTNGHIGFNEPGSEFDSVTRKVELTPETIEANARFFASKDEVPTHAYSMGIGSILKAKKIVLFAYGSNKADAIKGMIEGTPTIDLPASALQNHADVIVIVDEAAASKLTK